MMLRLPRILAILIAPLAPALADVKPARIFQNHMVLQQGRSLSFWGTAAPGEPVTVACATRTGRAIADAAGHWEVTLGPLPASSQGTRLVFRGHNEVIVEDVVVGEVWHASGQSNMAMTTGAMAAGLGEAGDAIISTTNLDLIRFCRINEPHAAAPQPDFTHQPGWIKAGPGTARNFSAVAFIFARRLRADLQVPIGIIDTSAGGKPIEPFIPLSQFQGHPVLEREKELAAQGALTELKQLEGGVFARDASWLPGAFYNSRIHPMRSLAIAGAIWYQGESNSGHGEDPRHYRHKMRALIRGWRSAYERDDLPFYFVQLPGYAEAAPGWPLLREEQRLSMGLPNTGMAVTIDLHSPGIHPPNKIDVGERLASWALSQTYGRKIPCSGPLYDRFEMETDQMVLHFKHADSGLMTGVKTGLDSVRETPGAPPNWFEMLDSQGRWHKAAATIRGESVIVSGLETGRPVAVRYAYDLEAKGCNLYNRDGLPAAPFCTHPATLAWPEAR